MQDAIDTLRADMMAKLDEIIILISIIEKRLGTTPAPKMAAIDVLHPAKTRASIPPKQKRAPNILVFFSSHMNTHYDSHLIKYVSTLDPPDGFNIPKNAVHGDERFMKALGRHYWCKILSPAQKEEFKTQMRPAIEAEEQ